MKAAKVGGGCLLAVASAFYLLAVFMFLDPLDGETPGQSVIPGLFFGSVVVVPGLALFWWGRAREAAAEFEETLMGYIRSHDRFTTDEMAAKVGQPAIEVERLVVRLGNRDDIDLVFHRPDRTWLHRGRINVAHAVVDRCPSCGASIGSQIIFAGEQIACPYCDSPLRSEDKELPKGPRMGIPPVVD
jgi:hypothetical protein